MFSCIEFNLDTSGIDAAAITIGLTYIVIHGLINHFACGIIGDGNHHSLCVTEHTCPYETEGVDGTVLVGEGDVVFICRNYFCVGVLLEVVCTKVADVVVGQTTDGTGCIGICHNLVFGVNTIVQFILIGIEVGQVEEGRLCPVAIEAQVRHV